MGKFQKGFTLIEMVMVIVILAIFAAAALPRFFNFKSNANIALIKAAEGAVRSASANARIKCVLVPGCNVSGGFEGTVDGVAMRFWNGHLDGGENTAGNVHQWVQASGFTLQFVPNAITR